MKILVYCTQLLETGGIENHILEFCEHMSSSGVVIDLIVPRFEMQDRERDRLSKYCNNLYLYSGNRKLKWFWLAKVRLSLLFTKYDALYTNGQGSSIHLVSKWLNYKNWVHHHHSAGDIIDQQTWGISYRKALISATHIVACSTRNVLDMTNVLNRRIETIPCFSRNIKSDDSLSKLGHIINLGYYGRLIRGKGIEIICRLSEDKDCEHIRFHIWGAEEFYTAEYIKQYNNIIYHGRFVSKEELIDIGSFLDGFLLLSDTEGLPISLLEMMSAGVPWVATDRGGIPDIACDERATRIISDPSDYGNVKKTILELVYDIKSNVITREKQQKVYQELFAASVLVDRWSTLFKRSIKL